MSRFLFVVPPIVERVRPTAVIGRELATRGHEVAWTGHRDVLAGVVPAGATIVPVAETSPEDDVVDATAARLVGDLRSPAGLILLWNDFLLPLGRAMLPAAHAAVDGFGPDVVVADQQALAGAAVAHLSGLPWVTIVPTSAGLADPLWDLPEIKRRIRRRTHRFLRDAWLDDVAAARIDPQASPYLVVAFTTETLAGPGDGPPGRHLFVGPCLDPPADGPPFDWDRLDLARPLVVVTLEPPHEHDGARLHRAALDALSSLDVQAVVAGPRDVVVGAPAGVLAAPRATVPALVRRAAAVVCDGGHGTVCGALADGVPVVVAPRVGAQLVVADQVVRAGAGVRVPAGSADAAGFRRAIERVLADTSIRRGAQRVRDSFAASGGAVAAADHLEALLDVPSQPRLRYG